MYQGEWPHLFALVLYDRLYGNMSIFYTDPIECNTQVAVRQIRSYDPVEQSNFAVCAIVSRWHINVKVGNILNFPPGCYTLYNLQQAPSLELSCN